MFLANAAKPAVAGGEPTTNPLKIFWLASRRASLIRQDKRSRTIDYSEEVAVLYDKSLEGRKPKARLGILKGALSWAEFKDQKEKYYSLFDDILALSISLKTSHPKSVSKALEKLLTDAYVRKTWEWNPLAGVEKEKIKLAEETLVEVYEKIGDNCIFSKNAAKWYAKADEIESSWVNKTGGIERREKKLESFQRIYY